MDDSGKPRTRGFVTTSQGNRVRVDELDMAVLNIGHGNNPMTNGHLNVGRGNFLRPIYNVEPNPDLAEHPRRVSPGSHEVFGDGNRPETIRQSTSLHQFDQIHAINPYAYDPVTAARSLLAPQGQLVVTGTERNPFAHPIDSSRTVSANIGTRKEPNMIDVTRRHHQSTDIPEPQLSNPLSSTPGDMHQVHKKFPHKLSDGKQMPTQSSQSHIYRQIPSGYVDVTPPPNDQLTFSNTLRNTGRRMTVEQANQQWQEMNRPSPQSQSTSQPTSQSKKRVSFQD